MQRIQAGKQDEQKKQTKTVPRQADRRRDPVSAVDC